MLVALVVPLPASPDPVAADPAAPCPHPASARVPRGTLAHPRRSFCQQCQQFFEE
jgi:hypothetical protein